MKNATFRQLKTFATVARRLSFSRAAEELHVTQPAVSEQIKQLEGHVGLALFEKLGKKIYLTPAGEEMLRYSAQIIEQYARAEQAMQRLKAAQNMRLRAGMITAGGYLFPHLLATFMQRHPGVELEVAVQNREELLQRLDDNVTDIVVIVGLPQGVGVACTAFAPHPFVMVASPDHPLAGQRKIPLAALAKERFLVRESGSDTFKSMKENFLNRFGKPVSIMEIRSTEAIKQAVIAGLGVSFLSAYTIGMEVQSGRIAVLDVEGFPVADSWQVAHRADKVLAPIALAFKTFLLEEGASQIAAISNFTYYATRHGQTLDAQQFHRQLG